MHGKIAAFVANLALPSSQTQLVINTLEDNSNLIAFLNESESETCWNTPTSAILPGSAQDVSITLKIINFFQVKFSVRSGGHSPNPGWSSIGQLASLGPGERWDDVYEALDPYNVSVIGGRIPHVGVGGLILGGGYSHFSAQYGLAADNVKNFEIFLADGTITDANSQQNVDLFWALKGGGPNFGIVTRLDLYTIPVREIWYSVSIYSTEQVPTILSAFVEWQENGAYDSKGTVGLVIGLESTTILYIYSEPANNPPATFAPFYNISAAAVVIPPGNGTVLSWTTLIDWNNAKDDVTVRAVSIATTEKWKELGEERGLFIPFEYMNDASRDQDPLASYGSENLSKLKAVSQKYDPTQVPQKLQNDGFLLSKA